MPGGAWIAGRPARVQNSMALVFNHGEGVASMSSAVGIGIFAVFIVGIWFSYRLFMRGDTAEEKVAALLPPGFKPDLFHRMGDTYVGYEKGMNLLVLGDCRHSKVLSPNRVVSLAPVP